MWPYESSCTSCSPTHSPQIDDFLESAPGWDWMWIIPQWPTCHGYTPVTTHIWSPSLPLWWFSGRSRELRCISTQTGETADPGNLPGSYGRSCVFMGNKFYIVQENVFSKVHSELFESKHHWWKQMQNIWPVSQSLLEPLKHNLHKLCRKAYRSMIMESII